MPAGRAAACHRVGRGRPVGLLTPEAIVERLDHSLRLLVGGRRDLPHRQQTLRATIEWSYDLLGGEARWLLAACSVFRGGVPLQVIELVCAEADSSVAVLDGLQELVDQSLLRPVRTSGAPRYLMLETIRGSQLSGWPARQMPLAFAGRTQQRFWPWSRTPGDP